MGKWAPEKGVFAETRWSPYNAPIITTLRKESIEPRA